MVVGSDKLHNSVYSDKHLLKDVSLTNSLAISIDEVMWTADSGG